jgi:CheY-like chemotaxis protein
VGQGTTFTFAIPVEVLEADGAIAAPVVRRAVALAPGEPAYKVLIADDVAPNRLLLVKLLERLGFAVRAVADGEAAYATWQAWRPALILMDVRMPGLDGRAATRRIRAAPGGDAVAIVALTASALTEERPALMGEGFDDVVYKPFTEATIIAALAHYLAAQFVYEEPAAPSPSTHDDGAAYDVVPDLDAAWMTHMHQANLEGDIQRIYELIEAVRETAPALADRLDDLAGRFAYDEIVALLG